MKRTNLKLRYGLGGFFPVRTLSLRQSSSYCRMLVNNRYENTLKYCAKSFMQAHFYHIVALKVARCPLELQLIIAIQSVGL